MSDSEDTKVKPSTTEEPKPLELVRVEHDYIEHSQTDGTTMENKSKDR